MSDSNHIAAEIGPSFASECEAAGLAGLPFSIDATGVLLAPSLTADQVERIEAAIAAHDPSKPAPAPAPTSCTRLGLMRAFSELGLWPQVKAFIAGDETRQEQWDLATTLKLSDPIMVAAIQAFALSGIMIDPVKLATRANELVA